jgi:hypothetical protein
LNNYHRIFCHVSFVIFALGSSQVSAAKELIDQNTEHAVTGHSDLATQPPTTKEKTWSYIQRYWPHVLVFAIALVTGSYIYYQGTKITTFELEKKLTAQDYEKITVTQAFEKMHPVFDFMVELINENKDLKTRLTYVLQAIQDPDVQKTETLGEHVRTINQKLTELTEIKKQN